MTFNDLNLNNPLLNALSDLGYTKPTTIQHKVFSVAMSGQDVIGIAQTGTGKTFAFLLPCLRQWKFTKGKFAQILILVPTRELVVQVEEEVKKLTTYMNVAVAGFYGGVNIKSQLATAANKLDIIIATPGRLLDLTLTGTLQLKAVKKLIIDEVDELLNLGFRPQLLRIFDLLPEKRQNLLFSATITDEVEQFIVANFNFPTKIEAAPTGTPLDKITQSIYHVPNFNTKVNLLVLLLKQNADMSKVLVFTSGKHLANLVYDQLSEKFPEKIGVIHSNKDQNFRFNAVNKFENGSFRVLIATDIIARGLDIAEVTHVINFEAPDVPENYIHRIGRTGRADKNGNAISFITEKEIASTEKIEALMNLKIPVIALPSDLVISSVLIPDEIPKIQMKTIEVKLPNRELSGPAFHEKSEKNKQVNERKSRGEMMKLKYKKPKKRAPKK